MSIFHWKNVMDEHLPESLQTKLSNATIGIAGAGGLGSNCAVLLTRTGIGHLVIVDHDIVSVSNLNRQQYLPSHIGMPKVEALKEILLNINPGLKLTIYQQYMNPNNILTLFKECQFVIEAVDNAITKKMLVETLITVGYTVISASGVAGWGGLPMTQKQLGKKLLVVGDHTYGVSSINPPLAPRVNMAASMQADAILCALLNTTNN